MCYVFSFYWNRVSKLLKELGSTFYLLKESILSGKKRSQPRTSVKPVEHAWTIEHIVTSPQTRMLLAPYLQWCGSFSRLQLWELVVLRRVMSAASKAALGVSVLLSGGAIIGVHVQQRRLREVMSKDFSYIISSCFLVEFEVHFFPSRVRGNSYSIEKLWRNLRFYIAVLGKLQKVFKSICNSVVSLLRKNGI